MYSYKNVEIFRIWLTNDETVRHPNSMENYCPDLNSWLPFEMPRYKNNNTMTIEKNISVLVYSMVRIKVLKLPVSNKKNHVTFMVVLKNFAERAYICVFTDEFNVFYRWIQWFFTDEFNVFYKINSLFFYRWIQCFFTDEFNGFFTDEFNVFLQMNSMFFLQMNSMFFLQMNSMGFLQMISLFFLQTNSMLFFTDEFTDYQFTKCLLSLHL